MYNRPAAHKQLAEITFSYSLKWMTMNDTEEIRSLLCVFMRMERDVIYLFPIVNNKTDVGIFFFIHSQTSALITSLFFVAYGQPDRNAFYYSILLLLI